MKREFEMTQEDLSLLMEASQPVVAIALQCGPLTSPQARANVAWAKLGMKMGFDCMSVEKVPGKGPEFFRAEPTR